LEVIAYIEKAKTGDQVAFTFLLDHYWNEVYERYVEEHRHAERMQEIIEEQKPSIDIAIYHPERFDA